MSSVPVVFVVLRLGVTEGLLGSGDYLSRTEKYKITLLLGQNYGEEKVHKRTFLHNINVTSNVGVLFLALICSVEIRVYNRKSEPLSPRFDLKPETADLGLETAWF